MKKIYTLGSVLLFFGLMYSFLPHLFMNSMTENTLESIYSTFLALSLVIGSLAIMVYAERHKV